MKLMAMCKRPNISPSSAYKYYKCRCNRCLEWKSEAARRTNDKEKARERSRVWRLNNKERSRENSKKYQRKNPHKVLEWQLKKYNLTLEEYNNMYEKQNGKCAICGGTPNGMQNSKKRLCVDHDIVTNKVRGLLCGSCNVGLGHFDHSTELLNKGIKYIQENCDV